MTITTQTETPSSTDFAAEWKQWHERHDANRADAHGFLAVTSLHWLSAEPAFFDDAPGAWSTGEAGPVVGLGRGESLVAASRGRGIGASLTTFAIDLARARGRARVVMNSGPYMLGAHALYFKLGFERVAEREGVIVSSGRELQLLTFVLKV